MKIFLDIGNTFVKTASSRDNKLEDGLKVLTEKFVEQPKITFKTVSPRILGSLFRVSVEKYSILL